MNITLNQQSYLSEVMRSSEGIMKHWHIDFTEISERSITEPQYRRLLALFYNKKFFEINKMLSQLNFKRIIN